MGIIQYFHLTNVRILLALNHWLSQQSDIYALALGFAEHGVDLLVLATLAWLWFWPDPKARSVMQPLVLTPQDNKQPGRAKTSAVFGKLQKLVPRRSTSEVETFMPTRPTIRLSRVESRAQVLVFIAAALLAYIVARLIALGLDVERPFMTYLPVHSGVAGAFIGQREFGSFPSDYAVLLGALPIALLQWNSRLAWAWGVLAIVVGLLSIALGLHYPSDVLGGFILGIVIASAAVAVFEQQGQVYEAGHYLARTFDLSSAPYCYFLYFFLGVLTIEFLLHFQHLLDVIYSVRGTF
ncbi:MAG: phosphatase PAP2 family protein [Abitibacteriaceae bacterium]|nr:phosphatase PAP2 family protein [Abditibacteriaceae bacterium]